MTNPHRLARALGWFSVGLGLTELLAARNLDTALNTGNRLNVFRLFGLRELINGIGILVQPKPSAPWLWARVAGDVLDLGTLGEAMQRKRTDKDNVLAALVAVAGVTVLDVICASQLSRSDSSAPASEAPSDGAPHAERSLTVGAPAAEVRQLWQDGESLAKIMGHFAEVRVTGDNHAHWTAHGPLGKSLEWDTQMTPNPEVDGDGGLRWRSLPGAKVPSEMTLRLIPAPGGRGTEMHLSLRFEPPGGALGKGLAKLLGAAPAILAMKALARAKNLVEAGEIPTLERNPTTRTGPLANAF